MFLSTVFLSLNDRAMPFIPEYAFFSAGIVLLFVSYRRASARRKIWKANVRGGQKQRYRMPVGLEIEQRLYSLGVCICWAIGFPEWYLRVAWAISGLYTVFILLYRNNLKTQDVPPYDAESLLRLSSENVTAV